MILVHKLKLKGKGHQQEQEKTTLHINPKNKCIHIVGRTDTCRITKLENLPSISTMWFNIYYRLQYTYIYTICEKRRKHPVISIAINFPIN